MALTLLGMGLGAPAEENALNMFGGIRAKSANMGKLTQAMTLEGRGVQPADIWQQTGWFKGPEGKWRFEIPDEEATLHPAAVNSQGNLSLDPVQKLSNVLIHPKILAAYPELSKVDLSPMRGASGEGMYNPAGNTMSLAQSSKWPDALSASLHETQHAIQHIEGFAEGGSPDDFLTPKLLNDHAVYTQKMGDLRNQLRAMGADPDKFHVQLRSADLGVPAATDQLAKVINQDPDFVPTYMAVNEAFQDLHRQKLNAYENYRNLAGEAEAFNVQARHATGDYSTFPPAMEGMPAQGKQIIRLGGEDQNGPLAGLSLIPVEHDPWAVTAQPVDHDPFKTINNGATNE